MQYGVVLTTGDAADAADLAVTAEQAGWDAVFGWEVLFGVDAWVSLTAAAMKTSTIKLGTMLTPLPRRKPWDLASTTGTLDRLSGGRVILTVGLGALHPGWTAFEADQGRRTRAELLDEGLDVLFGLWGGQPFSYDGKHYQVSATDFFLPPPNVQQPRIKTWCVALSGADKSMRRAARCDGLVPNFPGQTGGLPADGAVELYAGVVPEILQIRADLGLMGPYDVVIEQTTDLEDRPAAVAFADRFAEVGATWYLDADWTSESDDPVGMLRRRIEAGPPK